MKTISDKTITSNNLREACGKSVLVHAVGGFYVARGFDILMLGNIASPHANIGNDAFTEVYFTTASGNLYRIWNLDSMTQRNPDKWALASINANIGVALMDKIKKYDFEEQEINRAVLEVGKHFTYGKNGRTTKVTAILAVNANRLHSAQPGENDLTSGIREEFVL